MLFPFFYVLNCLYIRYRNIIFTLANSYYSSITDHAKKRPESIEQAALQFASSRDLVESWDTHVMPLTLSKFSFPRIGGSRMYGSLGCIRDLLERSETASPLFLACHTVSHAYLANKSRSSGLVSSHRSSYGKSLRVLKVVLSDPDMQRDDATLLTVWILCLYEVSSVVTACL
jgi:Fungal specific transcription factor domain